MKYQDNAIYSDRMRTMLSARRTQADHARKQAWNALADALTPKQLQAFSQGKPVKTKSPKTKALLEAHEKARLDSLGAHSAYQAFLDRMPEDHEAHGSVSLCRGES